MDYLIEAERILRLREAEGCRRSFQDRALSHVYTYFRIIVESIRFVTGHEDRDTPNGPPDRFSVTAEMLEAGLDANAEKTSDIGYDDIHLDVSGRWRETLYTKIYGVPETLLTMLSQVVKLANGKQRLETIAMTSRRVSEGLRRHIKRLERNIWTFQQLQVTAHDGLAERALTSAVHRALIIYFYRMVVPSDAMLLQDLVSKALDDLVQCLDNVQAEHDLTLLVAWATFVVACEAATPPFQQRALACLAQIEKHAASSTICRLVRVARKVWDRRQLVDDWTFSWLDVAGD